MARWLDMIYATAATVTSPVWAWHMLRTGKHRTDWRGLRGQIEPLPPLQPGQTRLMIHAVSVGEVMLIRQLVELFEADHPQVQLVITTHTNTGYDRAAKLFSPRHAVLRYPYDISNWVARFLDRVKPTAVALVENEVWPNFTAICEQRDIPVAVINGRLTQRSFKRYQLIRPVTAPMYARLTCVAAQTKEFADRFIGLGADANRVQVLDTMKWDTAKIIDHVPGADQLAKAMGIDPDRPLVVAGSTGDGEEQLLIEQCPDDVQLLLVPRKPERFAQVAGLDATMIRRSNHPDGAARPVDKQRLFLLDTMGELSKAYALADVVVVGRSFNGWGGSDPIEPIGLGKATLIGPDHHNFQDAVRALHDGDGLVITDHPGEAITRLCHDRDLATQLAKAGRCVILSRQGSTQRHVAMLLKLLQTA